MNAGLFIRRVVNAVLIGLAFLLNVPNLLKAEDCKELHQNGGIRCAFYGGEDEPNPEKDPLALKLWATVTPISCNGAKDGVITVTATGGTPPYKYRLDEGEFQESNVFTGLGPGKYKVTARCSTGCRSDEIFVIIDEPEALYLSGTVTPISCHGANDGTITATAAGGSPPYEYRLDEGEFQQDNIFTGVNAGSHIVTVRDKNKCSPSRAVTLKEPPKLELSGAVIPISCHGANDGTITVTATGGSPPYEYSLDEGEFQQGNVFSGVSAGDHTVTVMDKNGCTARLFPLAISETAALKLSATVTPISCHGADDGKITATAAGGSSPYEYSLDEGEFQQGNVFSGVSAGDHTVTVMDKNGCTARLFPVAISETAALKLSATASPISCHGANDGTITVTVTGGSPPYEYSLDKGEFQKGNVFTGVSAGDHTVTVMDKNGCTARLFPVAISETAALKLSATASPISCHGANDGTITVTVTGGSPPYEYSLDKGEFQKGNVFTGVSAGKHTVTVRDKNGCTARLLSVAISETAALKLSATVTPISCHGADDGKIILTSTGGSAPYEYRLDGGSYQKGNVFTGVSGAEHTVTVRDNNGCTSSPLTVILKDPAALKLWATVTPISCHGAHDGKITISAAGGVPPYMYSLNSGWFQPGEVFTLLKAGDYMVVVRDAAGCTSAFAFVTISEPPVMKILAAVSPAPCNDPNGGKIAITGTGGTPPYRYSINGEVFQSDPVFTNLASANYRLQIRDAGSCIATKHITVPGQPNNVVAFAGNDAVIVRGKPFQLHATGGKFYRWYPSDGLSNPDIPNPVVTIYNDATYQVTVSDENGCSATDDITLKIAAKADIYVPNAFTPNGDGKHDVLRAIAIGIKQFDFLRIYNRWGQLIFESRDISAGWDGRLNGVLQNAGTFVYAVQGRTDEGMIISKTGALVLLR